MHTEYLNRSLKSGKIALIALMGETVPPSRASRVLVGGMLGHNDNNYIKAHKIGGKDMMLSDTPVGVCLADNWRRVDETIRPLGYAAGLPHGQHWRDDANPAGHMCMSGVMAHGFTDPETGIYTGAMGCQSLTGPLGRDSHVVFTIHPEEPMVRRTLAKVPLPRGRSLSVMHSMGHTTDHVILVAHPLHMSTEAIMAGKTFTDGMLNIGNGTIFQVVNRKDGSVRTFDAPSFFCGHVVNAFEDGGDIVIDFTWYHADDTLMFYKNTLFSNIVDKAIRDAWPNAVLKRYRLKASGEAVEAPLLDETSETAFELPKVNAAVQGRPYCVFYSMQPHSYDYGSDPTSRVPGPFAATGVAKRNLCTGEVQGMHEANVYPAEVEFVPNPQGTAEDDGVLVGLVYDGNTNSSFLQVLDAKSMTRVAKAPLPLNVPFPVHASFFPEVAEAATVI